MKIKYHTILRYCIKCIHNLFVHNVTPPGSFWCDNLFHGAMPQVIVFAIFVFFFFFCCGERFLFLIHERALVLDAMTLMMIGVVVCRRDEVAFKWHAYLYLNLLSCWQSYAINSSKNNSWESFCARHNWVVNILVRRCFCMNMRMFAMMRWHKNCWYEWRYDELLVITTLRDERGTSGK